MAREPSPSRRRLDLAATGLSALVAVLGLLWGCAVAPYGKPGVTYEEWKRDDAECLRAAGEERGDLDREAYGRCMGERGYAVRGGGR